MASILPEKLHCHHQQKEKLKKNQEEQLKHHKHMQLLGDAGAVAAGTYAFHKAKKDAKDARGHKIKEEIAASVAVGSAGLALSERHEKKAINKKIEHEKHHHKHH